MAWQCVWQFYTYWLLCAKCIVNQIASFFDLANLFYNVLRAIITGGLNVLADIGCPTFFHSRQNSEYACAEIVRYVDRAVLKFFGDLGIGQVVCMEEKTNLAGI